MAQSEKTLLIRLNGEVAAGANKVSDKLSEIGSVLDRVGRYVREFEQESVDVYKSYEDEMLAAKYAMSAQVTSATELERMMSGLDKAAREWASTTIFHTDDVSHAINEAAHAGWSYEEILKGIPKAMLIAQAGGLDLSEGLDYLIKMTNTTSTSFDDLGTLVDQWSKAANSSATDINEMGEAFMSLSASAMFADSTQELFTLIAVLANAGVTGSQAGTLLRNAMMRMVAPTKKAKDAMAELGATEEDLAEWTAAGATAEQLEKLGFNAYKADGELKPMKDILIELHDALDGMTEKEQYDILSSIFPLRSINAATAFMKSIESGNLQELFNSIGNSEGYAEKGADIMMSGLTGAIETLKSKWEEFERSIGETLAPHIEKIAEFQGNIVDGINNMDPAQLSGITSMLTAIGSVGPLFIGVGLISKLVGVLTPLGALALGAGIGVSYLYGYLTKMGEIKFESNFGTLTTDLDELGKYVDGVKTKFDLEQAQIDEYNKAVQTMQTNYETTLNKMSEGLLSKVLKGEAFTEDDWKTFTTLGSDMVKYINEGIDNAQARDNTFLQAIFGDKSTDAEAEAFENAAQMLDWYYSDLSAEAYEVGEGIRMKLTEALGNGELTAEDREYIQAQVDRLNQIQAEIANRLQEQEYYTQLYKASRVSWDTVEEFLKTNEEKLKTSQANIDEQYDSMVGTIKAAYARARREGGDITYQDINGETVTISGEDLSKEKEEAVIAEVERERKASKDAEAKKFGDFSATAFDTLMRDSGFEDAWAYMKSVYEQFGEIPMTAEGEVDYAKLGLGGKSKEELESLYQQMYGLYSSDSSWLGLGKGKLTEVLKPFAGYGTVDTMLDMLDKSFPFLTSISSYESYLQQYQDENRDELNLFSTPEIREQRDALTEAMAEYERLQKKRSDLDKDIENRETRMQKRDYGLGILNNYNKDWTALNGTNGEGGGLYDQKIQIDAEVSAAEEKINGLLALISSLRAAEQESALVSQGATVTHGEGGLTEIMAQVGGEEGVDLTANISGDATELHATIMDEDGQVLKEKVVGDAEALEALLKTYEGRTIRVKLSGYGLLGGLFAEGGRADTPSVFGEAGPEWAIPEEHSDRTAALLDAARKASGFTYGDLISRYGGLNANPQNIPVVLNYSPVINANDTSGVAGALQQDKDKLVKLIKTAIEESRFRQSVEAFA